MPRYKLVIANADIAHAKEIERNVDHALRQRKPKNDAERSRAEKSLQREAQQRFKKRKAGEVHAVAESECPDGLPNCRNCGDPEYAASCKAAGHCPDCGTKHGIAPDSVVAANGYALVAVTAEEDESDAEAARLRAEQEADDRIIDKAVVAGRLTAEEAAAIKGRR